MKGSREQIAHTKFIYAGTCRSVGVYLPIVHVWTLIGACVSQQYTLLLFLTKLHICLTK